MWTYGRIPASQVVERDEPDIGGGVVQRFIRRHIYSGLDGLAAKRSRTWAALTAWLLGLFQQGMGRGVSALQAQTDRAKGRADSAKLKAKLKLDDVATQSGYAAYGQRASERLFEFQFQRERPLRTGEAANAQAQQLLAFGQGGRDPSPVPRAEPTPLNSPQHALE